MTDVRFGMICAAISAGLVAIPSTIAAVASIKNTRKLEGVETKVDGNLSEVKDQLKITSAALLALTKTASHAEGRLDEKAEAGKD